MLRYVKAGTSGKESPHWPGPVTNGDNGKEAKRQSKKDYASYPFIYHSSALSGQRESGIGMVFLLIFLMRMDKKSV